jgi:hypothetical protein
LIEPCKVQVPDKLVDVARGGVEVKVAVCLTADRAGVPEPEYQSEPLAPLVPLVPAAPCGIVKLKMAAELVPTFEALAEVPAAPVVVEPTATLAACTRQPVVTRDVDGPRVIGA